MNQANLAKLFHNYIESYNVLTDAEHDELYKWSGKSFSEALES